MIEKISSFNKQYALIGFIKHFGNEKTYQEILYYNNKTNIINEKDFPFIDKSFILFYQIIE